MEVLEAVQSVSNAQDRSNRRVTQTHGVTSPEWTETRSAIRFLVHLAVQANLSQRVGVAVVGPRGALTPLAYANRGQFGQAAAWWGAMRRALVGDGLPMPHGSWPALLRSSQMLRVQLPRAPGLAHPMSVLVVPIFSGTRLFGVLCLERDDQDPSASAAGAIPLAQVLAKLVSSLTTETEPRRERAPLEGELGAPRDDVARMENVLTRTCHELRAPLAALKASLQVATRHVEQMRGQKPPAQALGASLDTVRQLLALAERQVGVEDRLASDLADMEQIQAGKLGVRIRVCDLAQIIREGVASQRLAWPERRIVLRMRAKSAPVLGDPDRVAQVVANYLSNALKYSPPNTPIEVSLQMQKRRARVAVKDYGRGLTKEMLPLVWGRFYQGTAEPEPEAEPVASHERTPGGRGLGLGLYLCRQYVEAQRGSVGAISIPGAGSTFWFTLPRPPATSSAHEATWV